MRKSEEKIITENSKNILKDEKDEFIELMTNQGYDIKIIENIPTFKCKNREEMHEIKEKLWNVNFTIGFSFPNTLRENENIELDDIER